MNAMTNYELYILESCFDRSIHESLPFITLANGTLLKLPNFYNVSDKQGTSRKCPYIPLLLPKILTFNKRECNDS